MEHFEQHHTYYQNLLIAQYEVAEMFEHQLSKGELREDFIIDYVGKTVLNARNYLKRGFVQLDDNRLNVQSDILLLKQHAETIDLGIRDNVIVGAEDCRLVVEVKSTLQGNILNEFNNQAFLIKQANPEILCGVFAYSAALEKKTIMERFGYDYDKGTETYFMPDHNPLPVWYRFIDFILILDKLEVDELSDGLELQGPNQIYLRKEIGEEKYYEGHYPVARNLVSLVKALLRGDDLSKAS